MADYTAEERQAALAAYNGIISLRGALDRDTRDPNTRAPLPSQLLGVAMWLRDIIGIPPVRMGAPRG